jgi:hypothetical protein
MVVPDFEDGRRVESLKRLFMSELCEWSVAIDMGDHELLVYVLASFGFDFASYAVFLREMAKGTIRTKAPTRFPEMLAASLKANEEPRDRNRVNVWFDLNNDAFWVLSPGKRDELRDQLGVIRRRFEKSA